MSNLFKKVAVGISTIAMVSAMFVAPSAHAAAPGEVYKTADGTVWFITSDMQKRPFTSAGAFLSYGFLSFSQVKTADASVTALPTGSFIAPQDGRIFCATETKGSDVKGECALITGGMKSAFTSASVFTGLGFSFNRAFYGDSSFLTKTSDTANTADAHRPGVLVNNSGTVQLVVNGGLWGVPSLDVFNSWGWSFSDVVPANGADKTMTQIGVIPGRVAGQLVPTATTTPQPGTMTAALGASNPAASTLVAGQGQAHLADFALTGTGTVNSLTLKRIGVSADTTLSNVYLYDGATRLTDSASVASGNVTFAGLNLSVNGSRTLSVKSDIAGSTSGQTVGVQLSSVTLASGTVSGTPVSGNIHTIASASLATVAIASASGTFTDPGNDINVWQGTVTVGTRNVTLNRVALRQIGSIQSADIKNFRLQVDGTTVATTASLDANGYVTFSPNSVMQSGTRTLKVLADVTGGSGRTVQMSLRGAYDLNTTDSQYNVGILATGTFPFGPAASTVASGTLTVAKASDSPSANLVVGANDVSVGKWTFTAFGEPVKVETLTVGVDVNGTDTDVTFRNGRVLVDGAQVGSTTDIAAANSAATGQSFTTNFTVTPGTTRTVEVRADMYDSESTNDISAGTTTSAQFALVAGSSNGIPQVSLTPINTPTANVNANALTIGSGTISLAQTSNYPNQNATAPNANYKLASFVLTGNSSEAVNLNTIAIGFAGGDTFDPSDDLNNVYIKYAGKTTSAKATVSDGSSTSLVNSYSVSHTLGVNETMTIEVYGDIGSGVTAAGSDDTMITYMRVTGVTASSATTVYADTDSDTDSSDAGKAGQTITVESGSITATLDASSAAAQLVDDSGTVTSAAWKFAALTDSYTVTDVTITLSSATAVSSVALKANGVTVGTKPAAQTLTYSGLNIAVAANTNVVLSAELTMSAIGVGAGTTDSNLTTTLTSFTSRSSSGTSDVSANDSGQSRENDPAGNAMYAYKAVPTITQVALPTSSLAGGTMTIAKFTVSSGGTGTIAWKELLLEISKAAAPTLASPTLWNADTGEQITAAVAFQNGSSGVASTCVADNTSCELMITVGTKADDDSVQLVSGAKTYEVRATVGGTLAAGNFVSVTMDRNTTSHANSAAFTTNDNATTANSTSFTWSDESASATSDTGVSTWQKDYLVKNLPITWTLNRS